MNFKIILFLSCSILCVKCGLLNNILHPVVNEVNKIKENNLVDVLDEETKEVAEDLGGLLKLSKNSSIISVPDDLYVTDNGENIKNDQITDNKKEIDSKSVDNIANEKNESSDMNISTNESISDGPSESVEAFETTEKN